MDAPHHSEPSTGLFAEIPILRAQSKAVSSAARAGAALFKRAGCRTGAHWCLNISVVPSARNVVNRYTAYSFL
jgi:hypothetical protein